MNTFAATDANAYKALARNWASTVTVVTAKRKPELLADGVLEQDGYTATAFLTISINPPIILVSPTNGGSAEALLNETDHFAVTILAADQQPIADAFAKPASERGANWQQFGWHADSAGSPLIEGALGSFSAKIRERIPAGDHMIVLGDVTEIHHGESGEPLLYFSRAYGKPGSL
jgi:flavin reductase (DIM6/NTAB) family NADH-FMN oxidoreductase RutF